MHSPAHIQKASDSGSSRVRKRTVIQTDLEVGKPGDKYEQEADAVAQRVMMQPSMDEEEAIQMEAAGEEEEMIQMEPAGEEEEMVQMAPSVQMKCEYCEREEKIRRKPEIHRSGDGIQTASPDLANRIHSAKGGGRPLELGIQREMESKIGADFSSVNIHTGPASVQMNRELGAKAFTYKNHIFFNKGEYNPHSKQGKHLLAHELTHTIQQKRAGKTQIIQRTNGNRRNLPADSRFSGNAVLEAVFNNLRKVSVRNNRNGAHVRLIQEALVALNYPLPNFGADGIFGDETRRAVEAFQVDVGLGVDGVVGFRTIDFLDRRDRNEEVAPPDRPVTANEPFDVANAIVQPGAPPSIPLDPDVWGFTFPENVQVGIDVFDNGGIWQPVLTEVIGNYSIQTRLLPGVTEVTGPGGNTTDANYCDQINDLNALTRAASDWFMVSAVLAHERVHSSRFREALIHDSVIDPLETAIEGITVPRSILVNHTAVAELFIRINPDFAAALTAAQANWLARVLVLVTGDHAAGGPTDTAEHEIVDPMISRICAHARANGWPACPPLCP